MNIVRISAITKSRFIQTINSTIECKSNTAIDALTKSLEKRRLHINEFIDAYSDDQIYLTLIKELVNNHPVEGNVPERIKYSSFCRLWTVMMVGSIESMVKVWDTGDFLWEDIAAYFDNKSNEDKVEGLRSAFALRGLEVNEDMFKDFLAIKYIRNSYVHSNWSNSQREYVISRNFPGNVMNFDKSHFSRMQAVYEHVMNRLGMVHAMNGAIKSRYDDIN